MLVVDAIAASSQKIVLVVVVVVVEVELDTTNCLWCNDVDAAVAEFLGKVAVDAAVAAHTGQRDFQRDRDMAIDFVAAVDHL